MSNYDCKDSWLYDTRVAGTAHKIAQITDPYFTI